MAKKRTLADAVVTDTTGTVEEVVETVEETLPLETVEEVTESAEQTEPVLAVETDVKEEESVVVENYAGPVIDSVVNEPVVEDNILEPVMDLSSVEDTTEQTEETTEPVDEDTLDKDEELTMAGPEITSLPEDTEEQPVEEEVLYLASNEEIYALLANPEISIRETMEMLTKSDNSIVAVLVSTMVQYNEIMKPTSPVPTDRDGANNNYNLYSTIKNILSSQDDNTFRLGFSIINLFFKEYATEAFNEVLLMRFEANWSNSPTALKSYQYLFTIISMLADITTRKEQIKSIDINKLRNDKVMDFTSVEVDRLLNFYHNV